MKFEIFVELDTLVTCWKERVYHIVRLYLQQLCPPPPPLIRHRRDRTKCPLYGGVCFNYWGKLICIKLDVFKLCGNGHNNSQHCTWLNVWPVSNFVQQLPTTHNNIATTCNRVCQWTQHVTFNNVGSCWPTMLHSFARGFRMKRPHRGVFKEANTWYFRW